MINIIENLSGKKNMVLTEVKFEANDYKNYPKNAVLKGLDEIRINAIQKDRVCYSISRTINSPENNFVSFYVSFDVELFFVNPYESDDFISTDEMLKIIKEKQTVFDCGCAARSSLIIAQISSQITENTPIISPANLMI